MFKKYFEVRDGLGKLRFASVFKVDSEFYLKRLLQKLKPGQAKPVIFEVKR